MEVILNATPIKGKLNFHNQDAIYRFCLENEGVEQTIHLKAAAKTGEKLRMYKFLFGPLLDVAVRAYTDLGYELMDKVKSLYLLKCELAKDVVLDPRSGKEVIFPMEISAMSKARLLKFIQDIIFYLESEFEMETPDSSTWKNFQLTGKNLKSTKFEK